MKYLSNGNYELYFETETATVIAKYKGECFVPDLKPVIDGGVEFSEIFSIEDIKYSNIALDVYQKYIRVVNATYICKSNKEYIVKLWIGIGLEGIKVSFTASSDVRMKLSGSTVWGKNPLEDTFAVDPENGAEFIRAADGPATNLKDSALFDRQSDRVLNFGKSEKVKIVFDYDTDSYHFDSIGNVVELEIIEDFYKKQYGLKKFAPINKNKPFKGPNVGMTTYYAWLFNSDEKDVKEAAKAQQKELGEFGANSFVVDIEWCRNNTWGSRDCEYDHFNPDTERYPSGMKGLADYIRDCGLEPQLWVGINFEHKMNEEMKAHPEIVFAVDEDSWCGKYCIDMTHPYVLDYYLPKFFKMVKEWGYRSIKWDLFCEAMDELEQHHDKLYDPTMTSMDIQRRIMEIACKEMGEDAYMLYCAATSKEHIAIAADLFDACRIGRDQWSWGNFHYQFLDKLCSHYPLHNVLMYNDPDNMIIADRRITAADTCLFDSKERVETITTKDEAISRLTPAVLLGTVFNIGDDLRTLIPERMDMYKKSLPVADVHPKNIGYTKKHDVVPIQVQVSRPYGDWTVLAVVNTTEEKTEKTISLTEDLGLETGKYLVYDFWKQETVAITENPITVILSKHQTINYSIHKLECKPMTVSTTRHMLQGAVEIENAVWNPEKCEYTIACKAMKDYPYQVTVFVPEGYGTDTEGVSLAGKIEGGQLYTFTVDGITTDTYTKKIVLKKI